ncbi:MAG: RNA-binding protein [Rhodobacteraceae bacterium]|nr:RNA-binding protein [Paracoccaceae bacterium]
MPHAETTVRQCLVSREHLPTRAMIRFVVGPDDAIVPDLEERLPGRGLWVAARRDAIETAARKNTFAQAAKAKVGVPNDLSDKVANLLKRRCMDRLGLARRAGLVTCGADKVREALAAKRGAVLVEACDGSPAERQKMAAVAPQLPVIDAFARRDLGEALGRDDAVHVVLAPGPLTAAFVSDAARYAAMRGGEPMDASPDPGRAGFAIATGAPGTA